MNEQQLKQVYEMVDGISFSRAKKNIGRDFSDGVMMAQLIHHYRPKSIQLHSYQAANSGNKKVINWQTLNNKVLKRLGIGLNKREIQQIVNCVPLAIQNYLYQVLTKFQSPAEQVQVRQQIKKVQPSQSKPRQLTSPFNPQNLSAFTSSQQPQPQKQPSPSMNLNMKMNMNNILAGKQTDQVFELIDQIQVAYSQLLALQDKCKLKDEYIKNLQKKVEKMVFS